MDGNRLGARRHDELELYCGWRIEWDSSMVANGAHSLTVRATDAAGNTTTSAPVSVTTQNNGPASPSAYRRAVRDDGPVGYWRLGERSHDERARDESCREDGSAGYRIDGTYYSNGVFTFGTAGALVGDPSTSVQFNNTSTGTYMQAPIDHAWQWQACVFSAEVWARPTGGAGRARAALSNHNHWSGTPAGWWALRANADDRWELGLHEPGGGMTVVGGPVGLNRWTHLVGTVDGATARLYVDGVLAGSAPTTLCVARSWYVSAARGGPGNEWFPGRLDEVAVYEGALSAERALSHYQVGTGGSAIPTATATVTATRTGTPTAVAPSATSTATPTVAATVGPPGGTSTATATATGAAVPSATAIATASQTVPASATPTPPPPAAAPTGGGGGGGFVVAPTATGTPMAPEPSAATAGSAPGEPAGQLGVTPAARRVVRVPVAVR